MKNIRIAKNRIILISLIVLLFLLIVLFIFLFNQNKPKKYPENPISQESISSSYDLDISLQGLQDNSEEEYKLWALTNQVKIDAIGSMAEEIDPTFSMTEQVEGEYYYWSNSEGDYLQYSLLKNILVFSMQDGIEWNETDITGDSFTKFVKRFLNEEWDYTITRTQPFGDNSVIYYANRYLYNDLLIETSEIYNETDYLMLRDRKIVAGRILLTTFFDTETYVPITDINALTTIINNTQYPKSLQVNPGRLASIVSIDEEYLNEEIFEIENELEKCTALSSKIVYLYTSFEQEFLTPVYKFDLECSLDYQGKEYSVPAISYVNAIQSEYVKSLE